MTEVDDPPSKDERMGFMSHLGWKASQALHNFFYRLGEVVGTYPWRVIAVTTLIVILCGLGLSQLEEETREEKLWVPGDTRAQDDKKFVDNVYGNGESESIYRRNAVFVTLKKEKDVLEPVQFDRLLTLHNFMLGVTAEHDGQNLTFPGLCYRRGDKCDVNNVLALFDYQPSNWDTKAKILAKLNSNTSSASLGVQNFNLGRVMGGLTYDNGQLVGAKAFSLEYWLQNNETKHGSEFHDDKARAFEDKWLDAAEAADKDDTTYPEWTVDRIAERSFSDEFGGAITADINLLQIAIVLNLTYATLMLSRWSKGCLGFRGLVVLAGIISVGFAIVATYGLCAGAGLMFTPLMNVMPFLILGLGVDDMFVIVNSLDSLPDAEDMTVPRKLALTLAKAGPSITLTSFTDFFAFLVGSNTSLPALSRFSIYCAVGILFDFALQITFFCGWLAVDLRRKANRRGDCLCCCAPLEVVEGQTCCGCQKKDDETLRRLVETKLAIPLCNNAVKAAVIAAFAALAGLGIAGAASIRAKADVNDFFPAGSYLHGFFDVYYDFFTTTGAPTAVYLREGVDYSDPAVWPMMEELYTAFKNTELVDSKSPESWIRSFLAAPMYNVTRESFYADLQHFLNHTGAYYSADIVFDAANTSVIRASRLTGFHVQVEDSADKVDSMDNLRDSVKETSIAMQFGDRAVFPYTSQYLNYEQYKSIEGEAAMNLTLAMIAVSVIVMMNIINPLASVLVIVSVGMVVMNIVGYMYWWGLNIDSVTVIMLVLALGLSVDYSAHLAHGFMHKHGTGNQRMVEALCDIGIAVINGAMSTFLAVIVLGFSASYVFQAFFKQLFLCITFGLAHGLILLPVLLSITEPKPFKISTGNEEDDLHLHSSRSTSFKELALTPKPTNQVELEVKN